LFSPSLVAQGALGGELLPRLALTGIAPPLRINTAPPEIGGLGCGWRCDSGLEILTTCNGRLGMPMAVDLAVLTADRGVW